MTKKLTSMRIEPGVLRKLKYLSFKYDKPLGDVLEALADFADSGQYIKDAKFQERFNDLLELAFLNVGEQGGFGAGHPDVSMKENGKSDLNELQEKIRKYEEGNNE